MLNVPGAGEADGHFIDRIVRLVLLSLYAKVDEEVVVDVDSKLSW